MRSREEDDHASLVVMVGRICSQKDPAFFGELAACAKRCNPELEFVWAGDGDVGLRRVLERHGVDVTGWLDSDALSDLLSKARLYVHSARYEGFPLSVLDAAAFRVPVIVRPIDCFAESGLPTADSPEAMSRRLTDLAVDGVERDNALRAGDRMLAQMNEGAQRNSLRELYSYADEMAAV
ncbi:glycosyltransferase [Gordonia soli]|uniref:glycosyltransferase n=1 Tax=Gordonia soli TaxID=320799 RepID=UPI001FE0D892|nr:glycosyltransferase [Gordonia soli]